jgi:parallel beta-helix repeat protein
MLRSFYLIVLFLSLSTYSAAEELCGIIDTPTTLAKAKSPYRVRGDLYISPSARLTLEAGVELIIVPGEACGDTRQLDWSDSNFISIKVDGALFITGTPLEPVRIAPENHKAGKIQWDGIRIRNKRPVLVQIENLHIAGAHRALSVSYSSFHVANSLFIDNNTGIWLSDEAEISLYNNLFTGNRSAAVYIEESNPSLIANIFYQNPNYAIWSDSRPKPRIEYNLFYQSGDAHCWRCPPGIGVKNSVNERGDSTDRNLNLFQDPIFLGSPADLQRQKLDPSLPTPRPQSIDSTLHHLYAKSDSLGRTGLPTPPRYTPLGYGIWRLSRYSPALDAAPDISFFRDENDTRGDIGLFGGKLGRTRAKTK